MEKINGSSNGNTSMYIIVYPDPNELGGHSKSFFFFDEYNIVKFFSSTQSLNFPANPKNTAYTVFYVQHWLNYREYWENYNVKKTDESSTYA